MSSLSVHPKPKLEFNAVIASQSSQCEIMRNIQNILGAFWSEISQNMNSFLVVLKDFLWSMMLPNMGRGAEQCLLLLVFHMGCGVLSIESGPRMRGGALGDPRGRLLGGAGLFCRCVLGDRRRRAG